ncbi:MAG: bifunctional demethylmenaquinone methyltransferase/2-methoxy-6-polyprenyl-1,4-benzoquinol methylase UbiE [Planctomycetaceae bacterium]|nr:bifunctional demethylmenaquinone methyltransferase/2-methoxy-6-polyprenyl-1,4-benzoquinol methylase UbiE [Planctomycetaceae bacterium]
MAVDKSETRVKRMFGQIAPRYDLLNRMLSGGTDVYWRWRTVRTVSPAGDDPILDVCTGTGDLALAYWKQARGRCPVVGADFTHEMLRLANQKRDQAGVGSTNGSPGTVFLEADTQSLPFAADSFQIVSVAFGLRNVTDTRRGLREMVRVCRPGGKVVVLEFSEPSNPVFRRIYQSYFKHVLPRIGQLVAQNQEDAYNYLPSSVGEFPHGRALAEIMAECGLTDVEFHPLTFGIATLYHGTKTLPAQSQNNQE